MHEKKEGILSSFTLLYKGEEVSLGCSVDILNV